jgi:hypothetical protein
MKSVEIFGPKRFFPLNFSSRKNDEAGCKPAPAKKNAIKFLAVMLF